MTAIAIFTGPAGRAIGDCYRYEFAGTELTYRYNVVRIGAYSEAELRTNPNPFATVALVAWKALLLGKVPEKDLLDQKLQLAKALIDRKDLAKEKITAILLFLRNYLVFERSINNRIFNERLALIKKKNEPMDIIEMHNEDIRHEERSKLAIKLFRDTEFSDDKIASLVALPVDEVKKLRRKAKVKRAIVK